MKSLANLLSKIFEYLANREFNYNIRTLYELYEKENELLKQIVDAHGSDDVSPDGSHILRFKSRLDGTRRLIKVLETKTLPSEAGD